MDDHGGHPPFRAACVGSVELSTGKTPSARHVGGRQRLEHPENQCVRNVPYIAGMFLPRSADICRYLPVRVASPGRKVYETVCFLAQRCRSSVVEHPLGKGEVESSIPSGSTTLFKTVRDFRRAAAQPAPRMRLPR
jgi:hypothetical protein